MEGIEWQKMITSAKRGPLKIQHCSTRATLTVRIDNSFYPPKVWPTLPLKGQGHGI